MNAKVQLKEIPVREPQVVWRQDELIGGELPVLK
jgi:hypothetical protein